MKSAFQKRLAELQPPARGGQTRAIREQYEAIEAALTRGVTRQQVVDLLADEGVKISLPFFKNVLHRIRKERRQGTPPTATRHPPAIRKSEEPANPQKLPEDAWQRIEMIRGSQPDMQALRRQHLNRKRENKK